MPKETGNVAAKVEKLVQPAIEEMGLVLWDTRYEKEGAEWFLRVFVERAKGDEEPMDTDTCVAVSHALDPILDEADPISQSYYLEVGSPGLGRKLTKDHHFAACEGEKVKVGFFKKNEQGEKEIEGILEKKQDGVLFLAMPEGTKEIDSKEISFVRLCDDEDLFSKK